MWKFCWFKGSPSLFVSVQSCTVIWTKIIRFPVIVINLVAIPGQVRVRVPANSSSAAEYVNLAQ
jgi:hypothetical protein